MFCYDYRNFFLIGVRINSGKLVYAENYKNVSYIFRNIFLVIPLSVKTYKLLFRNSSSTK